MSGFERGSSARPTFGRSSRVNNRVLHLLHYDDNTYWIMSDDERSESSSDGEDIETTGLIATRQKRATAGNLYATLRANLDDEELQKELLAEDEGDVGEYEGSDKDAEDDDSALDSSSDDEDAGPPKEGDAEDLEGEKALKKQERAETRKKRKAQDARLKIPALRKKKAKFADDVKAADGSTVEKPKKKSERSNWLPTAADAPMRQSRRSLAVQNREVIHANLKQSAARSENQKRIMKNAAAREEKKKVTASLTQEERLKKCERIERETAKEFGRWEREEAERQRLREEALAAKRRRGIDGPQIRLWSGSVLWEGEKIKVKRVEHGSQRVDEIMEKKAEVVDEATEAKETPTTEPSTPAGVSTPNTVASGQLSVQQKPLPAFVPPAPSIDQQESTQPPLPWLQGIQEYASQSTPTQPTPAYTPSMPSLNTAPAGPPSQPAVYPPHPPQPQMYHGWPNGCHSFVMQPPPTASIPPPAPVPLIREQAQRTLLVLSSFPSLEAPQTTKRTPKSKASDTSALDPTPLTSTLLPDSYPSFTAEETRYLITRPRRRAVPHPEFGIRRDAPPKFEVPLPPPPVKQKCAVTSWPAKFRDPKTGLAYADMYQYKNIQKVLAGGCTWSGLLGCWVGLSGALGQRPASGVPEGFRGRGVVKVEGE